MRSVARRRWYRSSRLLPYLLISPTLITIGVLILYPMLSGIRMSFYKTKHFVPRPADFVGFGNYLALFDDARFLNSLKITSIYVVACVLGALSLGLVFALLLNRRFYGRALIRAVVTLPWAVPMVAAILIWFWMFDYQYGVFNYLVLGSGLRSEPILWLNSADWALFSLIVFDVWRIFPFALIVILTALQAVDPALYEAARIDGAGRFDLFRYVTLPSIRPTLSILALLFAIWSLRRFEAAWILTQGGPSGRTDLLVVNVYREAFRYHRPGYAATMAVFGLFLSLAIALVYFLRERRNAPS